MSDDVPGTKTKEELLAGFRPALAITAAEVRQERGEGARQLVVLDDDPTGTQSVGDLPVLTDWGEDDLAWALGTGASAVYVMTNSRSLAPETAAQRNHEVAINALAAARGLGVEVDFVSRSDSTLRGHYPLEPDVLTEELARTGASVDGVVIVPAFGDAGRITVGSVHYAGSDTSGYVPVGDTEFARDASFGYRASDLRVWVEEKSEGRFRAADVVAITLDVVRTGPEAVAAVLSTLTGARPAVIDVVEESDLRSLALGILAAERAGKRFVHRVGPPFVRAMIGQDVLQPLTPADVAAIREGGEGEHAEHGLIVVGSHVALTTRQLESLRARRAPTEVEIDVAQVLGEGRGAHLDEIVSRVVADVAEGNVVVRTSRVLVTGTDADSSLDIARTISDAVVEVVQRVLAVTALRFVVAKGGITSSDVASRGLAISRAMVRGPMLPGIVSLWEPTEGPARGIPYIVFAGNVGTEESLADVVDKLTA
ncbi:MAG TPA: four-carbon acid sugar kinase family protein [Intrasporangium sp.]|uniref:four-carbon acid sugar kinase family protein n=1 Tax=Intrasporangium sp. TaxID=1925024 RepID=UPI002B4952D0|nr:four-carbon acid sugar kinase family protein [Intrasporangium sp.]HKX66604.1 four-carbon acid sugar kinase family protein [Intrasporangium sp.]